MCRPLTRFPFLPHSLSLYVPPSIPSHSPSLWIIITDHTGLITASKTASTKTLITLSGAERRALIPSNSRMKRKQLRKKQERKTSSEKILKTGKFVPSLNAINTRQKNRDANRADVNQLLVLMIVCDLSPTSFRSDSLFSRSCDYRESWFYSTSKASFQVSNHCVWKRFYFLEKKKQMDRIQVDLFSWIDCSMNTVFIPVSLLIYSCSW